VANLLKKSGLSVVVAAGDTHRAGAIEQLSQHCERLSIKVIAQRYGADPSAVGRDALEYARKHYVDVVLVDTAGRMQTSKNLMDEMSKIVRVVKPDAKLFIGDSLAGNDTINQAREFFQYTNFDGAILTKVDADAKGGSAISIAHITSKPITHIGVGQGYDDLISFDPDKFIETLFGTAAEVTVEDLMSRPQQQMQPTASLTGIEHPEIPPEHEIEQKVPIVAAHPPVKYTDQNEYPKIGAISGKMQRGMPVTFESRVSAKETPTDRQIHASNSEPEEKTKSTTELHTTKPEMTESNDDLVKAPMVNEKQDKADEKPTKKSRFSFFGKKNKPDVEEDDMESRESEVKQQELDKHKPKEEDEKKKRKEDKDKAGQKDEVIYLTDEDIEDLLK